MSVDPATLTIASMAMTAASTAVSVIGQGQAADAQQAQLRYQQSIYRNNQILAQRRADDARLRGEQAADAQRDKTQQLIGRQRATLAGNGVELDTGSALEITTDTAGIGERDALTIRSNAEREALGYEAEGMNFGGQAALAGYQADNTSATLGQAATIFGGLGSVADKWYNYKRPTTKG